MDVVTRDPLTLARAVVEDPGSLPPGSWARAGAVLARQGLEEALALVWTFVDLPGMASAAMRHQLIALPSYAPCGDELARDVRHAWLLLTRACHAGTYDLPPTPEQLLGWIDTVDRFQRTCGPPRPPKTRA